MLGAGGGAVKHPQVEGAAAPVVGGRAVVPDHHHLLGALEVTDGADVPLAAVLLAPLPVRAPHHPHPHPLHHQPAVQPPAEKSYDSAVSNGASIRSSSSTLLSSQSVIFPESWNTLLVLLLAEEHLLVVVRRGRTDGTAPRILTGVRGSGHLECRPEWS